MDLKGKRVAVLAENMYQELDLPAFCRTIIEALSE
jgi:hypothetical protein